VNKSKIAIQTRVNTRTHALRHTHTHTYSNAHTQGVQCLAYGPLGGPNAYLPNDLLPHPNVTKVAEEAGKSNGQVKLPVFCGEICVQHCVQR